MNEIITSTGSIGTDYHRSEGRAYHTEGSVVASLNKALNGVFKLQEGALQYGRRRWVWRGVVTEEVRAGLSTIDHLSQYSRHKDSDTFPNIGKLEVDIPLSLIGNPNRHLIMVADNMHRSDVPERKKVYNFWQNSFSREINPLVDLESVVGNFELTSRATEVDINDLAEIWRPFGWTRKSVTIFINETQNQSNIWFSGVRERSSRRLVSACQSESISFGGITLVEDTEFGTSPEFEGRGLCTAAVIGLNGQILHDVGRSSLPLIYSELSMTTRSDVVARKVGMTIPLVENNLGLSGSAQILRRNVSVLDGREPNDLEPLGKEIYAGLGSFRALDLTREGHYRFWRNFIVGVLPASAIEKYYSVRQVDQILDYYKE